MYSDQKTATDRAHKTTQLYSIKLNTKLQNVIQLPLFGKLIGILLCIIKDATHIIYFQIYLLDMYECVACMYFVHHMYVTYEGQKRVSDPLQLELGMTVSYHADSKN